ncbi:MAG: alginate export family protein [Candidatus Eisenbacteria sp.]|nr:alginate export family protein [Candidatus Eisenbacteria bacterium]
MAMALRESSSPRRFRIRRMRRRLTPVLAILAGLLAAAPGVGAAPNPGRPPVPPPPVDFDAGLDTRVREVSLHNLLDFDYDESQGVGALSTVSDAHFFRVRHRIWTQLKFRAGWRVYSRFTTEWRKHLTPWLTQEKTEIILDNLYLDIPRIAGQPISLRLGRQDIIRGEGFILLDGGPNDGSRSIFQNALLLGIDGELFGMERSKLELMAIRNLAWDEFILANGWTDEQRRLGQRKGLQENDETAFGLYATYDRPKQHKVESYYFYKEEEAPSAKDPHLKLHTVGTRISGKLPYALSYAAEGAYQFGTHDSVAAGMSAHDHRSYGGYVHLARSLLALGHPELTIGAVYLSGNDPGSADHPNPEDQSWVPLFSRWPKWSELYIYTLIPEYGRVANWTNMSALTARASMTLSGRAKLAYTYCYMMAPHPHDPQNSPPPWQSGFFGDGDVRGHNHQWKLSIEMNKGVSWHFLLERFAPGDFYQDAVDDAYFLRWEFMFKS